MNNPTSTRITKADLMEAAMLRYEAARDAVRAREALAAASKPFTAARDAYVKASQRSEGALRRYEAVENELLLQDTAPTVRVAS